MICCLLRVYDQMWMRARQARPLLPVSASACQYLSVDSTIVEEVVIKHGIVVVEEIGVARWPTRHHRHACVPAHMRGDESDT